MSRLEANRAIVAKITAMVEKYPDMRFNQLLQNMNIEHPGVDMWYVESSDLLANITEF